MKEHIIEVRYDINGELESDKNAGRVIQRNNLTNKVDIYFKTPFKTIAEANASIGTMYGRLYLKLPNETTITLPRFTSENTSPKKMYDRTYFENGYLRLSFDLDKRMCIEAGRVECTLELSQDTGKTEEVDEEEIAVFQIDNYRTFYLQIEQSANTENPTITDDDLDWWDLVYSKISGAVAQLKNTGSQYSYLSEDGTYHKIPTYIIKESGFETNKATYFTQIEAMADDNLTLFFVDEDGAIYTCSRKEILDDTIFLYFIHLDTYENQDYLTGNIVHIELYEEAEDSSYEKLEISIPKKHSVDLLQQLYNGIPDWAKQREKPTYDSDEIYYDSTHSVYEKVGELDGIAYTFDIEANNTTYKYDFVLKKNGTEVSRKSIDLPLEELILSAGYSNGSITLTLKSGQSVSFSVSELVSGLATDTRVNGIESRVSSLETKDTEWNTLLETIADRLEQLVGGN